MSEPGYLQMRIDATIEWAQKFNGLSIRERAITSAGVLGVTWAIWFFLVNQHFSDQRAVAARDVQMQEAEIKSNEETRNKLVELAQQDPNKEVNLQLTAIRADIATMQTNLQSSLAQFIPPSEMTLVLRDLMADHKNLKFTSLSRLPARTLLPDEEKTNLYLHPMQLELEGEYLEILNYIASLENGDWQFNWQRLDYKTKGYPNGVATIEIETLSKDKHWLGL